MTTPAASFANHLQRRNTDAIGFIPASKIEIWDRRGLILLAEDNDDPCGFLMHGPVGGEAVRIYQAAVCADVQRMLHCSGLLDRLKRRAIAAGTRSILARCRSRLPSNAFWVASGFDLVETVPGGKRRGDTINAYRLDLPVGLFPSQTALLGEVNQS